MSICNYYDFIQFSNGYLDNIIDAVYVLLLKNSPRTENVYKQINYLKLSKNNFIQINEKYKDCHIDLCEQKPYSHLIHNTIEVLKHANNNNFNNILVLEDDFIFDNQILDKQILKDLESFINNNNFNLYYLGTEPVLFNPFNFHLKHLKLILGASTHSIIYSKMARDKIIKEYNKDNCIKNLKFHDGWYNLILDKRYLYYKPICYQPKEETDNKNEWNGLIPILDLLISKFDMINNPIEGYKKWYIFFIIMNLIIYSFIIIMLYKLI